MKRIIIILIISFWVIGDISLSQQWAVIESPSPSSVRNILRGVGFISSNDGWAVGVYDEQPSRTLTLHWNGTAWQQIPSPNPGSQYNELYAVHGFTSNNVVAIGYSAGIPATPQMLALHWDGSSWSQINTPVITGGSSFECMLAFAPNDIYAAGYKTIGAPGPLLGTLVAHWNGTSWNVLTTPNQASNRSNVITDMKGPSANDIWAVGYSRNMGENFQAMVLHKTGSDWNIVPVPQPGLENFLYSIDIIASNNIWVAGEYNDGTQYMPLFLHYNGTSWMVVNSPGGGAGLIHNSPNDIWSTGSEFVHYDGSIWSLANATIPPGGSMVSTERISSADMWSVGRYIDGETMKTLTMHYGNLLTGIDPELNTTPNEFILFQNYPNPFNPVTKIKFNIPWDSKNTFSNVKLSIYDILGDEIEILLDKPMKTGIYEVEWNASNYPSGVYFYKLSTNDYTETKKMILMK